MHPAGVTNRRPSARIPTGFTLVELLVVIAIVAILIALLLPSLTGARESGRIVKCRSNMKQVMTGFIVYQQDHKVMPGNVWHGPQQNLDWCGRSNLRYTSAPGDFRHPFQTSVLSDYLSFTDFILECPTDKRAANQLYDYTMVIRLGGARADVSWLAKYPARPQLGFQSAFPRFQGIPALIEEHATWYNHTVDDGAFAESDQFTSRHPGGNDGGGNLAYLDGSVSFFSPPKGARDELAEPADLKAINLKIEARGRDWDLGRGGYPALPWGWINSPR